MRLSPGRPLLPPVRQRLEDTFAADLSAVRVHDDAQSHASAKTLGARAYAHGNHIYLGADERADDLNLMGHEVAHTLQQSKGPKVQRYSRADTALEIEAHHAGQAAAIGQPFAVTGQTGGARIQRLDGPLDYLADKANFIPGFRMFTLLLGRNPINGSNVERSPANVLRALIEFIPGGTLITQALDNHHVFEKVGAWVNEQVSSLGLSADVIKKAVTSFIKSLSWSDLLNLGDVWERAKKIFTEPIERIIAFAKNLIGGVLKLVKEAILKPMAKLAEGTEGYNLLKGVLGKDPITDEPFARTPENLLGPFLKLIGQGETWENMQKANAIPRVWTWFQGALAGVIGFVRQVPALFVAAFKALELTDIVLLPRAFQKLANVFGGFLLRFITWAGEMLWTLLEIIFDVVSPGAWGYIKKTGAALRSILKNPLPFIGNLVKAAKLGFQNFASRFGEHLKTGLIEWLTGSLPGVYIPKAFALGEVVKFVFSLLGLTWAQFRQKLVKATSETIVTAMETAVDIVVILVRDGPAAAWDKIKDELSKLKDTVIDGIKDFVIDAVVKKAIPKLIAMFIPGAGFISAIISIYDTVMVFVNKIAKIIQVVKAFIDSIVAIAGGAIGAAADRVEKILAGLLSLAINFLAGFIGLGKVADKVMGVINKVRAAIDKALDKLIDVVMTAAKKLWGKVKSGFSAWWKSTKEFTTESGEKHTLLLKGEGADAKLIIKSDPTPYGDYVKALKEPASAPGAQKKALAIAKELDEAIKKAPKNPAQKNADLKPIDVKDDPSKVIVDLLAKLAEATKPLLTATGKTSSPPIMGPMQNGYATSVQLVRLTSKHPEGSTPSVSGGTWDDLVKRKLGGGSYYVAGHLLNHNLGGTGASWQNLTPLTQNSNNRAMESMLKQFETPVKEAVEKKAELTFNVKVNYGRSVPLAAEAQKLIKESDPERQLVGRIILAEQFVPLTLDCTASKLDPAEKKPATPFKTVSVKNEIQNTDVEQYQTTAKKRPTLKLFGNDAAAMAEIGIPPAIQATLKAKKPKEWDKFREVTGFTPAQQDAMRFHFKYRAALE